MTAAGGTPHVPTYPTCDATCTIDCGHCKGNHEHARLGQIRARADAATGTSWHWAGNTDTGEPYLATWIDCAGRCQILEIGSEPRSTTGPAADQVRATAREFDLGDPDELVEDWATDRYAEFIANAPADVAYLLGLLVEKDATIQRAGDLHYPEPVHALADECGHPDDDAHDTFESRYAERLCSDSIAGYVCVDCRDEDGDPVDWPCLTHRALDGQEER